MDAPERRRRVLLDAARGAEDDDGSHLGGSDDQTGADHQADLPDVDVRPPPKPGDGAARLGRAPADDVLEPPRGRRAEEAEPLQHPEQPQLHTAGESTVSVTTSVIALTACQ